uniref:2-dehydro-3-deoxy-phosphogluconate aldolase n=1 Tax=Aegilops tauschii subsp. strangulata TaxID=200361 RepID=A0A453J7X5_AEGTS
MSPGTVMEILHDLDGSEVLYIPGVLTPTEVISACNAGAKVVKVYPVSAIGGEMYMSALKKPFPLVPMVASQGITIGRWPCLVSIVPIFFSLFANIVRIFCWCLSSNLKCLFHSTETLSKKQSNEATYSKCKYRLAV